MYLHTYCTLLVFNAFIAFPLNWNEHHSVGIPKQPWGRWASSCSELRSVPVVLSCLDTRQMENEFASWVTAVHWDKIPTWSESSRVSQLRAGYALRGEHWAEIRFVDVPHWTLNSRGRLLVYIDLVIFTIWRQQGHLGKNGEGRGGRGGCLSDLSSFART